MKTLFFLITTQPGRRESRFVIFLKQKGLLVILVEVAIPVPNISTLIYSCSSVSGIKVGARVLVSLGSRFLIGVVVATKVDKPENIKIIKPITKKLEETPSISSELLKLSKWMSDYYACSWGEALAIMLPNYYKSMLREKITLTELGQTVELTKGLKKDIIEELLKGPKTRPQLIKKFSTKISRVLKDMQESEWIESNIQLSSIRSTTVEKPKEVSLEELPELTTHQQKVFSKIKKSILKKEYLTFLLLGVTGSGKTEIYLRAISEVLAQKRGAILLVPEIALTPQTCQRVRQRFGSQVAVVHSGITSKNRLQIWEKIRDNEIKIVVGARSAIFAPIKDLGLIVVDEEYENAYKQEESPRYNARDLAVVRAKHNNATLILGSATPALESYYNAQQGKYQLLNLPERIDGKKLPKIKIVDMTNENRLKGRVSLFSNTLLDEIQKRIENKEQSILFLNRRGFSPLVMCPHCGQIVSCPNCSVSLVYHKVEEILVCHICGHKKSPRPACDKCGTACIKLVGSGTQRVQQELEKYFPQAKILRLDQDISRRKGEMERVLQAFSQKKADVLIGTQMIAKGIDFQQVTLVGIISADTALHLPDFRAEERTFQMIVQVAGRAGRGGKPGLVIVQTYNPKQSVINLASQHDYLAFFEREIKQRQILNYPPFTRLINIICKSSKTKLAQEVAQTIVLKLKQEVKKQEIILGPVPAPREKIDKENRFQIVIKYRNQLNRKKLLNIIKAIKISYGVKVNVDVDPQNML